LYTLLCLKQKIFRVQRFLDIGAPDDFIEKLRRENPLRIVIRRADLCYRGDDHFSLPAVVKMLLDAGVKVDGLPASHHSSILNSLMKKVVRAGFRSSGGPQATVIVGPQPY